MRASGGVPKKSLKKARCELVGWARVSVQALIVPSRGTWKGWLVWPLLAWKPVTLPTAWQGSPGQEGSGAEAVLPSTTVVFSTPAALEPATTQAAIAREHAASANPMRRTRRLVAPLTRFDAPDMLLLSLKMPPRAGRLAALAAEGAAD